MYADIVFRNGQVITVDQKNSVVEAIAIKGNKILATGMNHEIDPYINAETKVFDISGKSLLPGFIDAHLHLANHAFSKSLVDCNPPNVESMEDLFDLLKAKAQVTPPGSWVIAHSFRDGFVAEKRLPTRKELDRVSKDHPILVLRNDGHNSVVNSKALEISGIDENTPNPVGGEYQRDENGMLTGRLIENAHFRMRSSIIPNEEELLKNFSLASDDLTSVGITTIHDAGLYGPDFFRTMQKAAQQNIFKPRVTAFICSMYNPHEFIDTMIKAGVVTGLGDQRFKIGPAKVFIDGSSNGPAIAVKQPYSHQEGYGILFYTQEELNKVLGKAHEKGFQITAHAVGDRAIEMMLNCIEEALEKHPREDHRHRIEHAGVSTPDLIDRMKKLNVIPVPNPNFYHNIGDKWLTFYGERVLHPNRDFLDAGLKPAVGSDMPAARLYAPLFGIWGAVNRITQNGKIYGEHQRISIEEAIRLYTWNGAYVNFEEDIKGSIEPGKLADLVVVDNQLLNVPDDKIKDVKVMLTMIDGEIVYQKAGVTIG